MAKLDLGEFLNLLNTQPKLADTYSKMKPDKDKMRAFLETLKVKEPDIKLLLNEADYDKATWREKVITKAEDQGLLWIIWPV